MTQKPLHLREADDTIMDLLDAGAVARNVISESSKKKVLET